MIEGSLTISLIDEVKEEDFQNYSFPELVEITGYLILYRITGIRTLNKLFPNPTVIRGHETLKGHALVIFELENLEELGLFNLQQIERGNVRIEKNDQLCYADRIDWSLIAGTGDHHISVSKALIDIVHKIKPNVAENKMSGHCPVCRKGIESNNAQRFVSKCKFLSIKDCPNSRIDPKSLLC